MPNLLSDSTARESPGGPASGRSTAVQVSLCAAMLLLTTGGPAFMLQVHVLDDPFSFEAWAYTFPLWGAALGGVFFLGRDTSPWSSSTARWSVAVTAAYVLWILAVSPWSVNTDIATTHSLLLAASAVFGVFFATRTIETQLMSLVGATAVGALGSAYLIVFQPTIGRSIPLPEGGGRDFIGMFVTRNTLAPVPMLGLIALAGFVALRRDRVAIAVSVVLVPLHLWLLIGARSATALMSLAAGLAAFGAGIGIARVRRSRGSRTALRVALPGAGFALVFVVALFRPLLSIAERDSTLSGRTDIWGEVYPFAVTRPLQGYGLAGFWFSDDQVPVATALGLNMVGSAHSGIVESLLAGGFLAAGLFVLICLSALVGSVVWVATRGSVAGISWLALTVALLIEHGSESFILWYSHIWILLVAAASTPWIAMSLTRADDPGLDVELAPPDRAESVDPIDSELAETDRSAVGQAVAERRSRARTSTSAQDTSVYPRPAR